MYNINNKPKTKERQPVNNFYVSSNINVKENPNQQKSEPQRSEKQSKQPKQPTNLFVTSKSNIRDYKKDSLIPIPKLNQKDDQQNINLLFNQSKQEDFAPDHRIISQSSPITKDFSTQNMVPLKESLKESLQQSFKESNLYPGDVPIPPEWPHIVIKTLTDIPHREHNDLDSRGVTGAHPISAITGLNGLSSAFYTIRLNAVSGYIEAVSETGSVDYSGLNSDPLGTAAVQSAINNLPSQGAELYFTEGTFIFTSPLVFTRPYKITGAGKGATVLQTLNATNLLNVYPLTSWNYNEAMSIRDMTLDGNTIGLIGLSFDKDPLNDQFSGYRVSRSTFENIAIQNFTRFGLVNNTNWGNLFINVVLYNNGNATDSTTGGARELSNVATYLACKFDSNLGSGLIIVKGNACQILGGTSENNNYYGIYVQQINGHGINGAATSNIDQNGHITSITLTNAGTGYLVPPTISFAGGGGGSGAVAKAMVNSSGQITEIDVVGGGSGYTIAPNVIITGVTYTPSNVHIQGTWFESNNLLDDAINNIPDIYITATGCNNCSIRDTVHLRNPVGANSWHVSTAISTFGFSTLIENPYISGMGGNEPGVHIDPSATSSLFFANRLATLDTSSAAIILSGINNIQTWSNITGTSTVMSPGQAYIADKSTLQTFTLPTTCTLGSKMSIVGKGTGLWKIIQGIGQTIHFGNIDTTTGATGYLSSNSRYDSVDIICSIANTDFTIVSAIGNITYN